MRTETPLYLMREIESLVGSEFLSEDLGIAAEMGI